ncbi:hypothetical protein AGABI1DRAFT_120632 [Agaricus bisporus var. burnettii JB137-S8]|uniref:Uncharacterized protein n=1 Tax=Agaricus bisporus var. burnettii (strain JB137-S8 / ATCC MYA-4627 / FGSC 10392) TaxID=597362 RepID=K5X7M3_AGABU|nr:uncharacterized protein AGABI1DRAFT_120632 [Agaricus bisporus var. burnettii JB137-S8]EKM79193.1 hypothetical protein AGABI1DRAFT_120632 [Agaricus bisporus var. burnettii JB137-S8]
MTLRFNMPSSFRVPALHRSRRSTHRLRSFHLSPTEAATSFKRVDPQASMGGTNPLPPERTKLQPNFVVPLSGSTIVTLAIIASIFFVISVSLAFLGAHIEDPYYKDSLDKVAETSPGIVLFGESVDVDVDEPSITIRWSILACGQDFVLPESTGVHGSNVCGLPSSTLKIFVDNADEPAAIYDPSTIPVHKETGHRRSIQNLVQFDSDHVLDVHNARLYPFDSYFLTSTLRAVDFSNTSVPIQKLTTVDIMSSFDIGTADVESFSNATDGTIHPSRDIDIHVGRPGSARFFALFLFAISWVLTHITVGHVILARRVSGMKPLFKHLISSGAILVLLPQLRNSMPDAPGLDGVLIDTIGYFPQMIITSIAVVILLLILAVREFDIIGIQAETRQKQLARTLPSPSPSPAPSYSTPSRNSMRRFTGTKDSDSTCSFVNHSRPPPSPSRNSTPDEIEKWEKDRMAKYLTGQFVFPPIQRTFAHRPQASSQATAKPSMFHRRLNTMTRLMEAGQVPRSHCLHED